MGVPQGSGYPLYLFWFYKKPKKDAAPIPNALTQTKQTTTSIYNPIISKLKNSTRNSSKNYHNNHIAHTLIAQQTLSIFLHFTYRILPKY